MSQVDNNCRPCVEPYDNNSNDLEARREAMLVRQEQSSMASAEFNAKMAQKQTQLEDLKKAASTK